MNGPYAKRPSTWTWKLMRFLIARSKKHAFLDQPWIGFLLQVTPAPWGRPLALRLLGLSPHYWVDQWTDRYPVEMRRGEVLKHEFERNAASRKQICDKLLLPHVRPDMTVLDFGCGPGFLAKAVSGHVRQVLATDVSRGVLACAQLLNPANNLAYIPNGLRDLKAIQDASVDLLYSFAVLQHLLKDQAQSFFLEFARVLKPGGMGICHFAAPQASAANEPGSGGWIAQRVRLRMIYYAPEEMKDLLHSAGFSNVTVIPIATLAEIDDDIGRQHLVRLQH